MKWKQINLGDAATFINGYPFKPEDWKDEGLEIIRIQNLTGSSSEINYFQGQIDEKYKVKKGDLLISWSATLGIYEWDKPDGWLNQHIFKVVFNKHNFDKTFFKYLISNRLASISSEVHGSTMKHITKQRFDKIPIPLPPLATQQKIAAILDTADAYRQKTKALIEKYDQLAQSLFLEMFGDPVRNEKRWQKKQLGKLSSKIGSGATPSGGKESYHDKGISLIRSMNVYDTDFKFKDLAFLNEEQAENLKNVIVVKNDVLFNITGASVCRCCIVPENILPARVNQHVAIIRPKKDSLSYIFLNRLIVSENCKKQLLSIGKQGGATREAITKEQLEIFEIIVPPLILQNQFAERIQWIEAQKQKARATLIKADELFNSLLQSAFKGELVE